MSKVLRRLTDAFSLKAKSGYAVPQRALVYETPTVPLTDVIRLYERDPTCKASVDLLAASAVDAVERIQQTFIEEKTLKIPYKVESYKLRQAYGGENLTAEAVLHWRINCLDFSGYGTGVLQVLLHSLAFQSDKRPAFAWMKAKIERIMPRIFEKYAGPDVLALLERE